MRVPDRATDTPEDLGASANRDCPSREYCDAASASGESNALRTMVKSEIERGADFLRLASALSALYPKEREEKRLLDAMLLAAPR